jgi:hypothetical protein
MVDDLVLYNSPFPERFSNSSAGAVDVKLRDGSSDGYHFQAGANFAQASASAEGPFGSVNACSWDVGGRKTYLQYVLAGRLPDPSMLFGVQDEEERSTCHLNEENTLSLDVVDSLTTVDDSGQKGLQPTQLQSAHQHADLINLGWMYTPTDKLMVVTHAAYLFNSFGEEDAATQPIGSGHYAERSWNSTFEWFPQSHWGLNGGVETRAIDGDGNIRTLYAISKYQLQQSYNGRQTLYGGFVGETFVGFGGRVRAAASERWDTDTADHASRFSPSASLSVRVAQPVDIEVGWGRYVQFPDVSVTGSVLGGPSILPLESTQVSAGLALRLGENTVVRGTVYQRSDTDLPYQPYLDPRLRNGLLFFPAALPFYTNSLSGKSRGYEVTVQRKSSRRISGFMSYSHGHTQLTDSVTGASFPSDWDQRNSVTAYLDYAFRQNIDLSSRYTYGSGFPIPGYLKEVNNRFYFTDEPNMVRLPDYQSLDIRLNKTYPRERWRMKLYAELVNATNHSNEAWGGITGFVANARAAVQVSKLSQFPILPSLGVAFEY